MSYLDLESTDTLEIITDNYIPTEMSNEDIDTNDAPVDQQIDNLEDIVDSIPINAQRRGTGTNDTQGYYDNETYQNIMKNPIV